MSEYTKGEITIVTPFSLIDNEIFETKGRLVAKCWRKDVAEILLSILNSQPDLLEACEAFMKFANKDIPKGIIIPATWLNKLRQQSNLIEAAIAKAKKE